MTDLIPLALALSLILFAYPFVLYPVLLSALVRSPGRKEREPAELPNLAMVVCALNEERVIRHKLENCLSLEYPREKLRILFVSDGSTDRTASIIREYHSHGIELIDRPQRRGKVSNLNDVVPSLNEEVIVLSDANVIYDRPALLHLIKPLAHPDVGAVSGKVIITNTTEEFRSSEEDYYSLEWKLQELGSRLYSMAGADGAMYAFRRELFRSCPNDTLIEDFVIPMAIVRQGRRVLFEPRATAWEEGPAGLREEFRRKVRIAAGAAQALIRGNGWPVGAPPTFWFVFISHKLLRWISPLTGIICLILAALSLYHWLSRVTLAGAAALLIVAGLRALTGWKNRLLNAPFYFVFGQFALLLGLIKGAAGRQSVLWRKANR